MARSSMYFSKPPASFQRGTVVGASPAVRGPQRGYDCHTGSSSGKAVALLATRVPLLPKRKVSLTRSVTTSWARSSSVRRRLVMTHAVSTMPQQTSHSTLPEE